jgi:hypothetical protein
MTTARKIRLDLATPAEVAIRAAQAAVEAVPIQGYVDRDKLTQAAIKIAEALDLVGSYVDERMMEAELCGSRTPGSWKQTADTFGRRLRHSKTMPLSDSVDKPCSNPDCCEQ